jgi:hypothetical protein
VPRPVAAAAREYVKLLLATSEPEGRVLSSPEPLVMFAYDVTISGETATGTTIMTYRLDSSDCSVPEVTWSYRTTFTAQRVR